MLDRGKCDNPTDFYELTPLTDIPDVYFFSFTGTDSDSLNGSETKSKNIIYGCDLRSFHKLVETTRTSITNRDMNVAGLSKYSITNPYNRSEISKNTLSLYEEKRWLLVQNGIPIDYPEEKMDEETAFKFNVLDVFQIMYSFGYP